jgi:diacylglycerol kinase
VSLARSFAVAFDGLRYLVRTQRNFRIELFIGALAIAGAAFWRFDPREWGVLMLTIAMVLVLEAVNTAIEDAVTLASPSFNARARAAKDVSAAAVLIAAVASVAVGVALFGPRLLTR